MARYPDSNLKLNAWRLSLALTVILFSCWPPACLAGKDQSAAKNEKKAALANGLYAVLAEAPERAAVKAESAASVILAYDGAYSDAGVSEPLRYIALDASSFVPLILEGAPETRRDGKGKTLLSVTLAQDQAKQLEAFTQAHLNSKAAIVLDGQIITIHKIREVIGGGKMQITRCTDNACEILRSKLLK